MASTYCLVWLALLTGCASQQINPSGTARAFDFQRDTFAFANGLLWEYAYDTNGAWKAHKRKPKPDYALHCVVLARSARQFFENAEFHPDEPVADAETYREVVHQVVKTNPRSRVSESDKIKVPGYADLRSFSTAQEKILKGGCGRAVQSYVQRGNWRMIFPFSRRNQARMAQQILHDLTPTHPVLVHLVRFPRLNINHTVLIFEARDLGTGTLFSIYDPNQPTKPASLLYDHNTRTFLLPSNDYFPGGRVDAYEIYYKWDY